MKVDIISPDKLIYEGEADSLKLPGKDGSFGILNNHAPIIASLRAGTVVVKHNDSEQSFEVNGGVVEVVKNKVIILAD
ncbi:MAG: ATP synthase F1 subunit epsilon [Flavobacteriales bacterium]|jgi:F-type H+-transporting ATPase subunit epsilon|nr:ATP synthase F1 subunit epsilon [Flavobacteriales bacterium]